MKIGFVVEGSTEKIIFDRSNFKEYLTKKRIDFVEDIINAEGNGNLLPKNIDKFTQSLINKGAEIIFIITDLDNDPCITGVRERIKPNEKHILIVAIKKIEAWFLGDEEALKKILKVDEDYVLPEIKIEEIVDPYQEIKDLGMDILGQGFGSKTRLADKMCTNGFSIIKASEKCESAKYFLNKLSQCH